MINQRNFSVFKVDMSHLLRHETISPHRIHFIWVQPAGVPPGLITPWTSRDTATLVEILRAAVYSRSTTNSPLTAMHLHISTPNNTRIKL